ncbi:MAG: MFS transporter, partial [Candidatus Eremiobacteraeota bacterium]|nr:MFS transporter [Candidatus Eremiobacteraeota bacterium]
PSTHAQALQQLNGMVEVNAAVIAYDYLFRISAILFFLTIPTVFFLRPAKGSTGAQPVAAAE